MLFTIYHSAQNGCNTIFVFSLDRESVNENQITLAPTGAIWFGKFRTLASARLPTFLFGQKLRSFSPLAVPTGCIFTTTTPFLCPRFDLEEAHAMVKKLQNAKENILETSIEASPYVL